MGLHRKTTKAAASRSCGGDMGGPHEPGGTSEITGPHTTVKDLDEGFVVEQV